MLCTITRAHDNRCFHISYLARLNLEETERTLDRYEARLSASTPNPEPGAPEKNHACQAQKNRLHYWT
jgi:hypothetical protein